MKEICKNCEHAKPTYKGQICELDTVNINNKLLGVGVLAALVLSYIAPSQILNLLSFVLEGGDMRYADAYGSMEAQGALQNSNIGYGDKLPIVFCLFFAVILLFFHVFSNANI